MRVRLEGCSLLLDNLLELAVREIGIGECILGDTPEVAGGDGVVVNLSIENGDPIGLKRHLRRWQRGGREVDARWQHGGCERCGVVWYDVMWYDVVWYDVVWYDVEWRGEERSGVEWYGVV